MGMHKKFEPAVKARIAVEAIKGEKTTAQISSEYGVDYSQISKWKQELIQRAGEIFARPDDSVAEQHQELTDKLHKAIGEITMENNWLKKNYKSWGNRA